MKIDIEKLNIRQLRDAKGISQQDLEDATGIPKGRINGWEQKGTQPKMADYIKLVKYFNLPPRPNSIEGVPGYNDVSDSKGSTNDIDLRKGGPVDLKKDSKSKPISKPQNNNPMATLSDLQRLQEIAVDQMLRIEELKKDKRKLEQDLEHNLELINRLKNN